MKLEKTSFNLLFEGLKNLDSFQSYERLKLSTERATKYAGSRTMNFGIKQWIFDAQFQTFITLEGVEIFLFFKKQIKARFL